VWCLARTPRPDWGTLLHPPPDGIWTQQSEKRSLLGKLHCTDIFDIYRETDAIFASLSANNNLYKRNTLQWYDNINQVYIFEQCKISRSIITRSCFIAMLRCNETIARALWGLWRAPRHLQCLRVRQASRNTVHQPWEHGHPLPARFTAHMYMPKTIAQSLFIACVDRNRTWVVERSGYHVMASDLQVCESMCTIRYRV